MAKKNNKNWKRELKRCKSLKAVSSKLNKKGRIKGKNKKETRTLKGMCTHHVLTKKGKIKSRLEKYDQDTYVCRLCGHTFHPDFHEGDKLESTIANAKEILDQMKYILVKIGSKPETIDFVCQAAGYFEHIEHMYPKVVSIAKKRDSLKNKNKKRDRGQVFGAWKIRTS